MTHENDGKSLHIDNKLAKANKEFVKLGENQKAPVSRYLLLRNDVLQKARQQNQRPGKWFSSPVRFRK